MSLAEVEIISIIIFIFWIPHVQRRFFYYLYFWQLKSYRTDRSLEDIRKDKRIIFPRTSFLLLAFLPVVLLFSQERFTYYLLCAICLFLSSHSALLFIKKRWRVPLFTKKMVLAFAVILFLWILLTFYFRENIVFLIPAFEIFLPVFMVFCISLVEIPASAIKRALMRLAKRKREKLAGLIVVGITGSYGKTSTKDILYSLLVDKYGEKNILKTEKNVNAEIGVAKTILNKLNVNHKIFICEMGAYKRGEIKTICDIARPQIAILTGINEQHMATQGSQENIIKSKYELIESLQKNGVAFFNGKNKYCRDLYEKTKIKKYLYGQNSELAMENLEGAKAAAKELGMTDEEIRQSSEKIENKFPGVETKKGINGLKIIDATYSANPESVITHLDYIKKLPGKKIIVMTNLIELGSASKEVHGRIGIKIAEVCDLAILTTKEDFREVQEKAGSKVVFIRDPQEIFKKIQGLAGAGDIILLESRVPAKLIDMLLQ